MRIRPGRSPPRLGGAACLGPHPLGCGVLLARSVLSAATKGPTAGTGDGRAPLLILPGTRCQKSSPVGWAGGCPWARRAPLSVPCAAPSSAGPGRRLSLRQAASWRLPSASLPRCCWEEGGSAAAAGAGGGGTAPSWGSAPRFVPFQGPGDWCQGLSTSPHGEGDASSLSGFPLPLDPTLLHSPVQGLLLPVATRRLPQGWQRGTQGLEQDLGRAQDTAALPSLAACLAAPPLLCWVLALSSGSFK